MKGKHLFLGLVLICLSLLQAIPSLAASASFVSINSLSVDCPGTTLTINLKLQVNANVADYNFGGTNYDLFEVVLYDGAGTAFAYKATLVTLGANGTYNILYSIFMNLPSYRPFEIRLFDLTAFPADFAQAQAGPLLDTFRFDPNDYVSSTCTDLPWYGIGAPVEAGITAPFADGRINNWDTASPAVIFGHDFETGRGLVVYSPEGALLLEVHPEQIAAVEECPAENTLIASSGNIALYRLSSCEYQLNAPSLDGAKTYVIIFNDLYENTGYNSHEE